MTRSLYAGPVVDAHHHVWDPRVNHHPWLTEAGVIPFRYGDYRAIRRPYLPPEIRADAAGQNLVGSVYVETEWDPADPLGEVRYASALSEQHGLPNAIVAQAWLDRADAPEVLAAHGAAPLVRSVRHKPTEFSRGRTLMSDAGWRRGYALLARHGLHFDLQTPWWNLGEAAQLAADIPETLIILNHTGLPADRSPAGLQGWRDAMAHLAEQPNVAVKISGLGQPGQPWAANGTAGIVREAVALFGPDRVMFASNFPVDSLCTGYDEIYRGFREAVADHPEAAQRAMFCDNARRIYRFA
ncbi:amidohydrolase family protein [Belnapia sp. T6]|uniref:Amidohydrolase family protein n=1 Tax=Belnapia mucosa TaxID=2804532 RepID=A0ABS1V7T5_9PROT|nr:amidohydrolase family protein [Belnapia mucosa]MBL6457724.1 amidohydrolase family protein [Belnapia mucosa]